MNISIGMNLQKIIDIIGCDDYKTKWAGDVDTMTEHYHKILVGKAIRLFERMSKMGASEEELKRVAEYTLVCIDCIKYGLNCKACYCDNGIADLKEKYPTKKED